MNQVEELLKLGRSADRTDKERAEILQGLLSHPGWTVYVALLDAHIQSQADQIMAPGRSVDGMVALEYIKGAMSGLLMAKALPSAIIEQMRQISSDGDDE